jgi:hypothetical protein
VALDVEEKPAGENKTKNNTNILPLGTETVPLPPQKKEDSGNRKIMSKRIVQAQKNEEAPFLLSGLSLVRDYCEQASAFALAPR